MQDTCTNCKNIKNSSIQKNIINNVHITNTNFAENKKCAEGVCNMESQQYKLYTKSNSKKLFAIMFSLWFFALALFMGVSLFCYNFNDKDAAFAAPSPDGVKMGVYIDLNLDDSDIGENTLSKLSSIAWSGSYYTGSSSSITKINGPTSLLDVNSNAYKKYTSLSNNVVCLTLQSTSYLDSGFIVSSVTLDNIYKVFSGADFGVDKKFMGFSIAYPTASESNNAKITSTSTTCEFTSTGAISSNMIFKLNSGDATSYYGYLLKAEWADMGPTNADVTINIAVQGANNSGVIVYLKKDGVMLAQLAQASNGSIVIKNLNVGETYELLISKPYMWSITATGSGELSGCKYTYTVQDPTTDADINTFTLSFSGGGTSNNVVIL